MGRCCCDRVRTGTPYTHAYLVVRNFEGVHEARAPASAGLVAVAVVAAAVGLPTRAASAVAARVARVRGRQEAVGRPEGEGHVLQRERQQARRVLGVLPREGAHVGVAVKRAAEQPVQIAVHLWGQKISTKS